VPDEDPFALPVAPPSAPEPLFAPAPPAAPPPTMPAQPMTGGSFGLPPAGAPGQGDAAARAFLQALGVADLRVSDAELAATMARLGRVMAVMIEGLREVLMTRTQIKSEFRISQTVIGAGDNNPLKFSISPEQAIEAMVKPTTRGYLGAVESAEQALRDVKAHEVAMLTGMEAALKGILKRLDPAVLEAKIETSGGFGSILRGKKQRTWEVYEKMYAEIADQAENDFNELFAREFARAYQDQLERLK
jgi:type VI secretion system protein ImpI/type VI secretion system protein